MKTAYENLNGKIKIWRCYTYGTAVQVPERIEGCPVTELAPYAFSACMDEEKLRAGLEAGSIRLSEAGEEPVIRGMDLHSVHLPKTLEKIGAYAFYNCNALEELTFFGGLKDLGAGLFTGCHSLKRLDLTLGEDRTSCLQEILMEVPEKLTVQLHGKEEACLIFPEFYEEGVENTPARILMTKMHGSGMNYRNCFYRRRFDFHAYDRCFYRAKAEEDFETVLSMAMGRLFDPWELAEEAKGEYQAYIREHLTEAVKKAASGHDIRLFTYLTENFMLPAQNGRELVKKSIDLASAAGFTEGTAYLMDVLHRNFQRPSSRFEL